MKTQKVVSKALLKSKMFEYLREVERSGEELVITDNNVPVLKIVTIQNRLSPQEVFAKYQNKVIYKEDLTTPTTDEWDEV